MLYGYTGRVLHVDLTRGSLEVEEPTEDFYRTYVGGSAVGLYYLLRHTPRDTDPLGPENTLTFALSGITGAPIAGQSRATAVARSPLTGAVGDSQAGGFWPAELKFAGFDAIVVRGCAPEPVFLWVKDGAYELRDARHLWGMTTRRVEDVLFQELGDDRVQVAQVGPAGERGVRFASIMNKASRAHGRTGMGAVMGAKRLKAVAVRGSSKKLAMADPEGVRRLMQESRVSLSGDTDVMGLAKYGTASVVVPQEIRGNLPTRHWAAGSMGLDRAEAISGEVLYEELLRGATEGAQDKLGRDTCYACAVRCKRVVESEWHGREIHPRSGGPEYETISTFGAYCDVTDLRAIAYANQVCAEYGVDTISAGATIAFAMECFEAGLIDSIDTGGIELRFGSAPAMIAMLEDLVARRGFGDVLAEGTARAAARLGREAESLLVTVKSQELPAHMPQTKRGIGLIYAVNPFGADHMSSAHDPMYEEEVYGNRPDKQQRRLRRLGLTSPQPATALNPEKVRFALHTQYAFSALDTLDVCHFVFGPAWQLMGLEELAAVYSAVTGWETTVEDLVTVGARRLNMMRAFNAREGFSREQDTLPSRFFARPLQGGASDGFVLDESEFRAALEEYYRQADWDPATGNPTRATLERLGLGWVADAAAAG